MTIPAALDPGQTVLVLIDFQEKLFPVMQEKEKLLDALLRLIKGVKVFEIPAILTEQYPKGLGPTLPAIKDLLPEIKPIEKICFNCCDEKAFCEAIEAVGRRQVLIAGIEAHICVYQTAVALARAGYQVEVVGDCISSRSAENRLVSLFRLGAMGIYPTTMEMALFELLKVASGDRFRQISSIVK